MKKLINLRTEWEFLINSMEKLEYWIIIIAIKVVYYFVNLADER